MAKIADIELSAAAALSRAEAKEMTMQAQKRLAQLVLPVAVALSSLAVQASAAEPQSPPASAQAVTTSAAPVAPAAAADGSTTTLTPTTAAQPAHEVSFGVAMNAEQLDQQRGGDVLVGQNNITGSVSDNTAYKISTGSNAITQGSFASSSGLPTVIQNTGANVLIQNATVLNVRFGD